MPKYIVPVPSDQEVTMDNEGVCVLIDYDHTYDLSYGEEIDMYDEGCVYHCSVIGVSKMGIPGQGDGMYSPRPITIIICRCNEYEYF